jgi:predicted histidine transporter YuiF (NhaC family)
MLFDSVHPAIRAMYVIAFASIALLLLRTGVVTINMGSSFNTVQILDSISVALLCGLLLGLSERTLPIAIGRRASGFLEGFGGDKSGSNQPPQAPGR